MAVLYKYSGAGNDFVVLDGRPEDVGHYREAGVFALCAVVKTAFRRRTVA